MAKVQLTGAKISIVPEFIPPVVPKILWGKFLELRDPSGQIIQNDVIPRRLDSIENENSISNLLSTENINLSELDQTTEYYIKKSKATRIEKIKFLWELALKYEGNPEKFKYIIDCLDYLKPLELAADIIKKFNLIVNQSNQKHVLSLLIHSAQVDNDPIKYEISGEFLNSIKLIQNFIHDFSVNSRDAELLKFVLTQYPSIFTSEIAQHDITEILNRSENFAIFSEKEKALLEVNLIFENEQSLNSQFLANTLSKVKAFALCFKISTIDSLSLSDSNKKLLKQFLLKNKSMLTEKIAYAEYKNIPICDWQKAYDIVTSNSH